MYSTLLMVLENSLDTHEFQQLFALPVEALSITGFCPCVCSSLAVCGLSKPASSHFSRQVCSLNQVHISPTSLHVRKSNLKYSVVGLQVIACFDSSTVKLLD